MFSEQDYHYKPLIAITLWWVTCVNREQSEQQKRQSSEVIAVVVVMVVLVLILKIVCMRVKLAFKYRVFYSYARSGSIKPRSLNRISFTKIIRIQSTPKNKESTYNLVNHWLEHGAHTSDRTNKHTSNGLSLLCTMYITFMQTYTIHLYMVAECIHLSVWRVCGVLCMRLWFYVYHYFIGLGM